MSWIRLAILAFFVSGLVMSTAGSRRAAMASFLESQHYEDTTLVPSPELAVALSFGHDRALADLLWCRALVYAGSEFEHLGDVENGLRFAEAIVALDPSFRAAYSWASLVSTYRPTGVDLESVMRGIEILEGALVEFPDDPSLYWELGAAYSYDAAPLARAAADRDQLRARGAEHLLEAAERGGGPPWLAMTNATRLDDLGQRERAVEHLRYAYAIAPDDASREPILARLRNLEASIEADALSNADAELTERAGRYPWLPSDFAVLVVGSRALDGGAQ